MTRRLALLGFSLQILAFVQFKLPIPLEWTGSWILACILAFLGIGCVTYAALNSPPLPVFRTFALTGSVSGALGWASWLIVALAANPGDPVINLLGLLSFLGIVLTAIATFLVLLPERKTGGELHHPWAFVFLLLMVGFEGFDFLHYRLNYDFPIGNWIVALRILPLVIASLQIALGLRAAPSAARTLSLTGGILYLLHGMLFLPTYLLFLLAFGATLIASIMEIVQRLRVRQNTPTINETMEE